MLKEINILKVNVWMHINCTLYLPSRGIRERTSMTFVEEEEGINNVGGGGKGH